MTNKIAVRDERLITREAYIRRERYVCLCLAAGSASGIVATSLGLEASSESSIPAFIVGTLFTLGWAYCCTLRLRHIESIRHYRSSNPTS